MARILHVHVAKKAPVQVNRRFAYDEDKLMEHFGGRSRLLDLTRQFGVPPPPLRIAERKAWNRDLLIATYTPVLLELAERMHQPLDLYQFVVELR